MYGLKLFGIYALAANKPGMNQQFAGSKSFGTPPNAENTISDRRQALQSLFGVATVAALPSVASALDMDAFMNSELESDKKNCDPKRDPKCQPKLSSDEALCQYGQGGTAKAEACKRVKAAGGSLPTVTKEKSLGGAYAI